MIPTVPWTFNEEVADVFTDMLSRSIPDYDSMRELMYRMARNYVTEGSHILDIGCSTGLSSKRLIECPECRSCEFSLIDTSKPMLEKCKEQYKDDERVYVFEWDITKGCPNSRYSVIVSCLTLQFVPIEYRQKIVSSIYKSLQKGGALFLVEKVLGNTDAIDDVMVKEYYDIKKGNAYTEEQIKSKRKSLAGSLVPLTMKMNEDLLEGAGFCKVDTFWRYLNFCGIVAVK